MKASELNPQTSYPDFPEFQRYSLPLDKLNAATLITLQTVRDRTGIPVIPSPLPDGWARTDGSKTSRHYAVGRLSDAGDIFPARGRCMELWARLQAVQNIGAVGLYCDTRGPDGAPWPMIHFDLRNARNKLLWARDGDYFYLHKQPGRFWQIVQKIIDMEA